MAKVKCDGCLETFDSVDLTEVSHDGAAERVHLCPRCVFIVALYSERGVKKEWVAGGVHPSVICSDIRKIVENEFYKNPHATYKKYLGAMIERQEFEHFVVHVPAAVIEKIGEFPFVFLDPAVSVKYKFKPGVVVTLDAGDLKLKRRLYGFAKIKGQYLKKYGQPKTSVVLFLPEVYDAEETVVA